LKNSSKTIQANIKRNRAGQHLAVNDQIISNIYIKESKKLTGRTSELTIIFIGEIDEEKNW